MAASPSGIDARGYNAIGIQAITGANDNDTTLILGGEDAEYNGCPSVLILDHFFDDEPVKQVDDAIGAWWSRFQDAGEAERREMLVRDGEPLKRRRRRRRRGEGGGMKDEGKITV